MEVGRGITITKVIAGLTVEQETTITKVVIVAIEKTAIKVTQHFTIARTVQISSVMVNDGWGKLLAIVVNVK